MFIGSFVVLDAVLWWSDIQRTWMMGAGVEEMIKIYVVWSFFSPRHSCKRFLSVSRYDSGYPSGGVVKGVTVDFSAIVDALG